jgi:hypothetical protein
MKHLVNVIGNVADEKMFFTKHLEVHKTESQKGGGNIHDFGKIKVKPDTCVFFPKIRHSLYEFRLDLRTGIPTKPTGKQTM